MRTPTPRPWDVFDMSHFDPETERSVQLNAPHSCQGYFWLCWGLPSHGPNDYADVKIHCLDSTYNATVHYDIVIQETLLHKNSRETRFMHASSQPLFSVFNAWGSAPNVSLTHESYYVCDSLHISDICGWYWGWGPSWREVHKNLSTTETETFCDESAVNVSLFIYSRALEAGALCPAQFFSCSPGGLWGEG